MAVEDEARPSSKSMVVEGWLKRGKLESASALFVPRVAGDEERGTKRGGLGRMRLEENVFARKGGVCNETTPRWRVARCMNSSRGSNEERHGSMVAVRTEIKYGQLTCG